MEVKLPTVVKLTTNLFVPGYIKYSQSAVENTFSKSVFYIIGQDIISMSTDAEIIDEEELVRLLKLGLFKLCYLDYSLLRSDQREIMNTIVKDSAPGLIQILGVKRLKDLLHRLPIGELV